jgi:general secretion pathway protein G
MEYCAYCGNPVDRVSFAPCPRCGRPTNGAPPPTAKGGGSNAALIIIAVVVGGLVVVAIIGILAAIAIPNLLTAMQRSKQKRTMADIRSLATAAESYATDNNQYPQTLDALAPKYIKFLPKNDGWGHPFEFMCLPDETGKCTGYVLASGAKDGRMERELRESAAQPPGATTNFDCDIVYANGKFEEYPEGVQH